MLSNYIKIAWRNIIRNKGYALINILGLAVGLACCILIAQYVQDELSYDNFHEKSVYFVGKESTFGGNSRRSMSTSLPLGQALVNEIPEVESYVQMTWPSSGEVSKNSQDFTEEGRILNATSSFFEVFNFSLKVGNPENVLDQPNSVVITEEMMKKYFPGEDPIGQSLTIQRYGENTYTVTGVARNVTQNSYLDFDMVTTLGSLQTVKDKRGQGAWGASMFHTYASLQEGADSDFVESKLADIADNHFEEEREVSFFFVPVSDLYISDLVSRDGFKGDMKYIYIFGAISLFILIIACINYMNLATARAAQRSQEVGIRKTVGADRWQVARQFLGEAVLISLFSFVVGLLIAELALPVFNQIFDKELELYFRENIGFLFSLGGLAMVVGLISGSYPAFYLSGFQPHRIMSGQLFGRKPSAGLRKTLVVFQYTVTVALLIGTIVVFKQLQFTQTKDLGFNEEQVIVIPMPGELSSKHEILKQELQKNPDILSVSAASAAPSGFNTRYGLAFDPDQPDREVSFYGLFADPNYVKTLGLEMAAGRFFEEERTEDSTVVLNEAAVEKLGWESPQKTIGRELTHGEVIGVIKDFHFASLRQQIDGVYIRSQRPESSSYASYDQIVARLHPENINESIDYIRNKWESLAGDQTFTYSFLDQKFEEMYRTEQRLSKVFTTFSIIAIVIACLGLLGLAAYSAERRTKEIGIRKVMGATVTNVVTLLSKDFLKLVALGFVIAVPIAWYVMNRWLQEFAYRIEIGPEIFAMAGGAALLIALATVSWQSVRAAVANPVDSLRSE